MAADTTWSAARRDAAMVRPVRRPRYGAGMGRSVKPRAANIADCRIPGMTTDAPCPRCGAAMIWTKASWHCLACRYKEGCC
jgi:hypothetical protein